MRPLTRSTPPNFAELPLEWTPTLMPPLIDSRMPFATFPFGMLHKVPVQGEHLMSDMPFLVLAPRHELQQLHCGVEKLGEQENDSDGATMRWTTRTPLLKSPPPGAKKLQSPASVDREND